MRLFRQERGFATIAVLVLIALLAAFLLANGAVLQQLGGELRLLDKKQRQKFESRDDSQNRAGQPPH